MKFGKVVELICCKDYAYFKYEQTKATYCAATDLYFVESDPIQKIIPQHHLADYRLESIQGLSFMSRIWSNFIVNFGQKN